MLEYLKLVKMVPFVLLAAFATEAQTGPVVLKSPNGALEISIATLRDESPQADGGQLAYRVVFRGQTVFDWSSLGLAFDGSPSLGPTVRIESSQASSRDETWTAVHGKEKSIRNHYNAGTVQTVETAANGRRLVIETRAYDDGVAFRYVLPEQPNLKEARIQNESTQFNFTRDAVIWPLILRGFQTSSEGDYPEMPMANLRPDNLVYLPLLLHLPGVAWVGLTEADIDDYASLFVATAGNRSLAARLSPRVEDVNTSADTAPAFDPKKDASAVSVIAQPPVKSAWRVLMIADEPGRLVESEMVLNLNQRCAIADTSWIQPGKDSWDWWNGSQARGVAQPGKNNDTIKYYIDFSARNKFDYMLIDGGWELPMPSPPGSRGRGLYSDTQSIAALDIPMLAEYAKSKNVRLWLITHFKDLYRQREEAFVQFEKWGIAGVKIDYMDRSDQWMINWVRSTAELAAKHHLMIDYHGATKPDGLERTYPNILTREGILGAEYNRWSSRATPKHDVTLAFTRMLAGPMDYTPGGFNNVLQKDFKARTVNPMVMHTRAHATALYVVFQSEFQSVSDSPDAYDGQKELDFLKAVPATWDETRVLNGVPPNYVTIARRNGKDWFVGSITDSDARDLDVPLSFLGSGSYNAEIYADGPDAATQPKDSVLEKRGVNAQTVLKLKLAPAGGCAIRLVPVP
jgi:alpha-glucosidase